MHKLFVGRWRSRPHLCTGRDGGYCGLPLVTPAQVTCFLVLKVLGVADVVKAETHGKVYGLW